MAAQQKDQFGEFSSRIGNAAMGNIMAAAAADYKKEVLATQTAERSNDGADEDFNLDDLDDDPELERIQAERLQAMREAAEKRKAQSLKGHGEYRQIPEEDFLSEVQGSSLVVCHFFHGEFPRCKIVDKHLAILAPKHFDTKFIRADAERFPFFVKKLAIRTLPCVVLFRDGVAVGRSVGFEQFGNRDDFSTAAVEKWLRSNALIAANKADEDEEAEEEERSGSRSSVRASVLRR